jgi:lysophospholipase L1-like esterase
VTARRPWGKRLAFGALTVLLVLAGLEGGLRAVGAALMPGVDASDGRPDCDAIVLLGVGDSMTYGWGAERSEAYPIRMRGFLERAYPGVPFKIYNLGVPGTTSSEGLARLEGFLSAAAVAPDFTLVLYGVNNRWARRGAAGRMRLTKVLGVATEDGRETARELGIGGEDERIDARALAEWISRDHDAFVNVLRARGTTPVFLRYFDTHHNFDQVEPIITSSASRLGVPIIDVKRPQIYYETRDFYSEDHYHLNAAGYLDVARRVSESFEKLFDARELRSRLEAKRKSPACVASKTGRAEIRPQGPSATPRTAR